MNYVKYIVTGKTNVDTLCLCAFVPICLTKPEIKQ